MLFILGYALKALSTLNNNTAFNISPTNKSSRIITLAINYAVISPSMIAWLCGLCIITSWDLAFIIPGRKITLILQCLLIITKEGSPRLQAIYILAKRSADGTNRLLISFNDLKLEKISQPGLK